MIRSAHRGLFVLAVFGLGCSSALSPKPDAGGQTDAPPDVAADAVSDAASEGGPDIAPDVPHDAAACECRVEDSTLTISWACYCASARFAGCSDRKADSSPSYVTYPACGLTTETLRFIGPSIRVWDDTGALVGRLESADTSLFECPSDPTLKAPIVRAGRFPDASCGAGTDAGLDARDGGGVDASCAGTPIFCTTGTPGGQCSDAGRPAVCRNGQWTCEPPSIPGSQCACIGAPPPGCTCGATGFSCPTVTDAGRGN